MLQKVCETGKAAIVGRGVRQSVQVLCSCGTTNTFYAWSWAGHGWAKCCGCGSKIEYIGHKIIPVALKQSKQAVD